MWWYIIDHCSMLQWDFIITRYFKKNGIKHVINSCYLDDQTGPNSLMPSGSGGAALATLTGSLLPTAMDSWQLLFLRGENDGELDSIKFIKYLQ